MRQDDTGAAGEELPPVDDGGMYGVFGEGKPRHVVGDSDGPPRRRPRRKRGTDAVPDRPADPEA